MQEPGLTGRTLWIMIGIFFLVLIMLIFVFPKFSGQPVEKVIAELPGGFKAEIEYGEPAVTPSSGDVPSVLLNNPPLIVSITLDPPTVRVNSSAVVTVEAKDLEGDNLAYQWQPERGSVERKGLHPESRNTYWAPDTAGLDTLKVTVDDTAHNRTSLSHTFFVYDKATEETAEHLSNGLLSLGEKNYPEAILQLSSVIQDSPNFYPAYVYRGYALSQTKEWDRAIEDYSVFLENNPDSRGVYLLRAQAYLLSELPGAREIATQDVDAFFEPTPIWLTGPLQPFDQLTTDAERLQWLESAINAAPKEILVLSEKGF